jgi:hypothetical protein
MRFLTINYPKKENYSLQKYNLFHCPVFADHFCISEVVLDTGKRYVLRRNPVRAAEIVASRNSKLQSLLAFTSKQNEYLQKHGRAKVEIALKHIERRSIRLNIDKWVECKADSTSRSISVQVDESCKRISLLDGCYCLTTNLTVEEMDKESVHARYKDLAMVEEAFRCCKTGHLEIRPIYVRKAGRTRAHVFVVMLSYLFVRELRECWREIDATVEENLTALSGLCGMRMCLDGGKAIYMIPKPSKPLADLFALTGIAPPEVLPTGRTIVDTKKNCQVDVSRNEKKG